MRKPILQKVHRRESTREYKEQYLGILVWGKDYIVPGKRVVDKDGVEYRIMKVRRDQEVRVNGELDSSLVVVELDLV